MIVNAIFQMVGWAFSLFAAAKIDGIVGKYLAYATIAYEEHVTDNMKRSFAGTMEMIKADSKEKADAWKAWRDKDGPKPLT